MNNIVPENAADPRESRLKDASVFWQREKKDDLHYEKSLSHHIGARNWEEERFYAYGRKHVDLFEQALRFINADKPERKLQVVEWGPGGGANALAFIKQLECDYTGVDISQENLDEAARLISANDLSGFSGIHIDINSPATVLNELGSASTDIFICTAVFPHLPDKEYAVSVSDIASSLLREGGICILHILLSDEVKSEYGSYNKDVHRNTVFTYEESIQFISDVGLKPLYCIRDDITTYSYFVAVKE